MLLTLLKFRKRIKTDDFCMRISILIDIWIDICVNCETICHSILLLFSFFLLLFFFSFLQLLQFSSTEHAQ